MALVDAGTVKRLQARLQERASDPAAPMIRIGNQVVDQPTPAVVPAKDGADELAVDDRHEAHVRITLEEGEYRCSLVGAAQAHAFRAFPEGARPIVIGSREWADFQCGLATCCLAGSAANHGAARRGLTVGSNRSSGSIRAPRRFVDAFRRRRIFGELFGRPSRPGDEFSAAIRTLALEDFVSAGAAECAFKRTDDRVGGRWRQVTITALAIWTELQHFRISLCIDLMASRHACMVAFIARVCAAYCLFRFVAATPTMVMVKLVET